MAAQLEEPFKEIRDVFDRYSKNLYHELYRDYPFPEWVNEKGFEKDILEKSAKAIESEFVRIYENGNINYEDENIKMTIELLQDKEFLNYVFYNVISKYEMGEGPHWCTKTMILPMNPAELSVDEPYEVSRAIGIRKNYPHIIDDDPEYVDYEYRTLESLNLK